MSRDRLSESAPTTIATNGIELMDLWRWSERHLVLFEDMTRLDGSLPGALQAMATELSRFDQNIPAEWTRDDLTVKVQSYSLRYVVPLYELLRGEGKEHIVQPLVVQLLSCVSWRHFDNCIDLHDTAAKAQRDSLCSAMRLYAYAQGLIPQDVRIPLERHYTLMAEQARIERVQPIELCNIWKRCSIFLFAGETIAGLTDESLDAYKCYVNYSGLAHDAHDMFRDVAAGISSLPSRWMNDVNPDGVLSVAAVRALYERIRAEARTLEATHQGFDIEQRWPLIHYLWSESRRTLYDE